MTGEDMKPVQVGPGKFVNIGKRTKDLLNKDFQNDQKITVTSSTLSGLTFTSSGIKKGEQFEGDVKTEFKHKNVTVEVKVDTASNIHTVVKAEEIAKGAKALFSFTIPDQKKGKVELSYAHEHFGVVASVGLAASPVTDLSVTVGNEVIALGGDLSFDSGSGELARYGGGFGIQKPDFSAAVLMTDKGDILKASYSHIVNPETKTTVGAEVSHRFSNQENTFTLGGLYVLDPSTAIKARMNNHGKVGALLQHEWRPKSLLTLSGEVDTKALDKSPKIGLAIALKP